MTIENCLAAKHNPANGCVNTCKWPGACGKTAAVEIQTIEAPAEAPKPKKAKKPKG